MEKTEFVPFELALRMKNIGYDIESGDLYFYSWGNVATSNKKYERIGGLYNFWKDTDEDGSFSHQVFKCPGCGGFEDHFIYAPLFQQAFRWFREKHNFDLNWKPMSMVGITCYYDIEIHHPKYVWDKPPKVTGKTYEEAELACIEKLIELVEQKQK